MKSVAAQALFCVFLVMVTANVQGKTPQQEPDTIFINGNIYTGVPSRPAAGGISRAQAIAVRGGRVMAVGTSAEISKLKGERTEVVDLGGRFVMPGFNDAHLHLAAGGVEKLKVDLIGVRSLQEMKARIAERARATPPGEWVLGRGWDHTLWAGQRLPTRQDLEAVTGDHPAYFIRVDGHIAVVNSAALKFAGITRDTPDPAGGKIDRDEHGEPTGILRERAKEDLETRLPRFSPARRRQGMELALAEAVQWGITSAQDAGENEQDPSEWDNFRVYEELEREGKLTQRVTAWLPFSAPLDLLQKHRARHSEKDPMLHTGLLKGYLDGSLGSGTAALLAPYADDPRTSGIVRFEQSRLTQMTVERTRAGFQIGFHAIGDRAAQMALGAFAEAARDARQRGDNRVTDRDLRFRVEHVQVLAPGQIARFRDLGVVASVQPCHLLTDMRWAEARLGKERARLSYPWGDLLHAGVKLAFGTDYPVEPITPFRGLYAAVTRKNEAGTAEYFPEQKLTIDQAIAAYTVGSAYAEFAEQDKGTLEAGKLADFVVLDRDITKVPPAEILKTRVLRTVVGGRTVYQAQ